MLEEQYIVESPWYQYILNKGAKRGEEQGIRQGIEQGEERGKLEGLRSAILALVAQRFPTLEAETRERVAAIADAKQLSHIVVLAGTAPDAEVFRQGLAETPAQQS